MFLEYKLDWIKIVDFSLIAKFLASPDNYASPSIHKFCKKNQRRAARDRARAPRPCI